MNTVRRILCVAILAAAPTAVVAEDYPSRPVRLLVAFAPGSPTDLVARVVAQSLGETFGRPIVVENRPGAGGIIASQTTKRANPDGYTILVTSTSVVTNVSLRADPGYKMSDFTPIAQGPVTPNLIAVHPSVKANSLQELIALAKTTPLSYASSGAGTAPNLNMEQLFTVRSKVNITHVPMGPPQAVNAAAGNQVPISATAMATAVPLVKAGRIRAIAITSPNRSAILPDVATVSESGFPGFSDHTWFSFFAPAGTPPAIVKKLETEFARIAKLPEIVQALQARETTATGLTAAPFGKQIAEESAIWQKVARDNNIKFEQ